MTPHDLLPDAIEALPEVADARLRHERADATLEYHLELPTFLRQTKRGQLKTDNLTMSARNAYAELEDARRRAWLWVPYRIDGDIVRVPVFRA